MSAHRSRRGYVALVFLVILPTLLLVLLLVLHSAQLEQARGEVQQSADAAALAAGLALVDDASLCATVPGGPRGDHPMLFVLNHAQREASRYAERNTVLGSPNKLELTADNGEDGDLIFGLTDSAETAPIRANLGDSELLPLINTVRVNIVRSGKRNNPVQLLGGGWLNGRAGELTRTATAYLDRAVLGFRPVVDKPLPLVPLALLSDRTSPDSWETQIEFGEKRQDRRHYVKEPYRVLSDRGDGLYEMTVQLSADAESQGGNCRVVHLGTTSRAEVAQQVRAGVPQDALKALGGELVLGPGNRLVVPGSVGGPTASSQGLGELALALRELNLTGEVRAWPLFDPQFPDTVVIKGFVAARVMEVRPADSGAGLVFVLQAACLQSASIVTATPGSADGARLPHNRYLCRVHLIQ